MTLQEFKAWFEGFTEAMKGPIYTSNTAMYTIGQADSALVTSGTAG